MALRAVRRIVFVSVFLSLSSAFPQAVKITGTRVASLRLLPPLRGPFGVAPDIVTKLKAYSPDLILIAEKGTLQTVGGLVAGNGDPVGQWLDQSGNNRHVSQATGAKRPVMATAAVNGRAGLTFDGATEYLEAVSGFPTSGNAAIFFVVKRTSVSDAGGIFWQGGSDSSVHPYVDNNIYEAWGTSSRYNAGNPVITILNTWVIYSVRASSSAWDAWLNNTLQFHSGSNSISSPAFDASFVIGDGATSHENWYGHQQIAAVVRVSGISSSYDMTGIRGVLQTYYGL